MDGNPTKSEFVADSITLPILILEVDGCTVRYVTTSRGSEKRARTALTKEPLTPVWIDTFDANDVYVDVGANVGIYAIYAGIRGARVFAFEPEALNYAELNKNIFVNSLHGRVTAYCMAISDREEVSVLYLSAFSSAGSHHDFGENRWEGDKLIGGRSRERATRPQQGCTSFPLDELVHRQVLPPPNHIKIDVDGFEYKVMAGAAETLRSAELKTILLEVDFALPESLRLVEELRGKGWKVSDHQLRINQHEYMREGKIESLMSRGKGGANFIFFKDDRYFKIFEDYAKTFVAPHPKGA